MRLDEGRAADLAELDAYLDEGNRLIRQAEALREGMERAGLCEGHRLLATQVLLAMVRLQHGMERHRATLEPLEALGPARRPAVPAESRRPWFGWFGFPVRSV